MRSESWKFIWQPNVSMRYFFATRLSLSPFAFAPGGSERTRPTPLVRKDLPYTHANPKGPALRTAACPAGLRRPGPFGPGVQEFAGTRPNLLGHRRPTDHTRHLFDTACVIEALDARHGPAPAHGLLDHELRVPARRNLREVRDAEDLELFAERLQPRTDDIRHPAADAGVHFVEDQRPGARARGRRAPRRAGRVSGRERLEREHYTRQFASGHDARERPQILTRVRRDEELRLVDAALAPGLRRQLAVVEAHLEPRARHRELGEQRFELARERHGCRPAPSRQPAREVEICRGRAFERLRQGVRALSSSGQQLALARKRRALVDHLL